MLVSFVPEFWRVGYSKGEGRRLLGAVLGGAGCWGHRCCTGGQVFLAEGNFCLVCTRSGRAQTAEVADRVCGTDSCLPVARIAWIPLPDEQRVCLMACCCVRACLYYICCNAQPVLQQMCCSTADVLQPAGCTASSCRRGVCRTCSAQSTTANARRDDCPLLFFTGAAGH
jgi:hypothetical protein